MIYVLRSEQVTEEKGLPFAFLQAPGSHRHGTSVRQDLSPQASLSALFPFPDSGAGLSVSDPKLRLDQSALNYH